MSVDIREGTESELDLLAIMFRDMWRDNGVAQEQLVDDYQERVKAFASENAAREFRFFIARDGETGLDVGCAASQLFGGLYPDLLSPDLRRYGYIWGVYVAPEARRKGLGAELTQVCVDALREAGCTHAVLHAAPMGKGVYTRMGFAANNEMRLDLRIPQA